MARKITLRQARVAFTRQLAILLMLMEKRGYEVAIDFVKRCETCPVGKLGKKSTHAHSLAADLHLYKDGKYLSRTEHHQEFGEWWEKQHPLSRWGGRFSDGNHYSFEWEGVK